MLVLAHHVLCGSFCHVMNLLKREQPFIILIYINLKTFLRTFVITACLVSWENVEIKIKIEMFCLFVLYHIN